MDVFAPEDVAPPAPLGGEWSAFMDRKPCDRALQNRRCANPVRQMKSPAVSCGADQIGAGGGWGAAPSSKGKNSLQENLPAPIIRRCSAFALAYRLRDV